jgi:hypothetical protein
VSSLIIIESKTDKYFLENFSKHLKLDNNKTEYKYLCGYTNLDKGLKEIKFDKINKLGIVLDANSEGIQNKLSFINKCLKNICSDTTIQTINNPTKSKELDVSIICYIANIDGCGEIETILKTIKSQPSIFADCLDEWRKCLEKQDEKISNNEFDKSWLNNYLRYDTCKTSKHKGNKQKYCSGEPAIKKDIWNLNHPALNDLKKFLMLLN